MNATWWEAPSQYRIPIQSVDMWSVRNPMIYKSTYAFLIYLCDDKRWRAAQVVWPVYLVTCHDVSMNEGLMCRRRVFNVLVGSWDLAMLWSSPNEQWWMPGGERCHHTTRSPSNPSTCENLATQWFTYRLVFCNISRRWRKMAGYTSCMAHLLGGMSRCEYDWRFNA